MDGDGKKPHRIIIITDFYKLHENKGKHKKFKQFKKFGVFTRLQSING